MQEVRMRTRVKEVSWVVYRMTVHGGPPGLDAVPGRGQWDEMMTRADHKEDAGGVQGANGVCERSEWDAMVAAEPGRYTLIRQGILSESEAERLARESPGGTGAPIRLKTRL